jgi:hypothetical protein|eukprot:COSAG01_NODE_3798_length_5687_cov_133.802613_2_plen_153_part_00
MVPCCKPLLLYSQSQLLCSPSLEIQIGIEDFLREHWETAGAVPWYNIAKNIDEDTGMSGELGLPNSSQHDCRLCLRCIRREESAAVGRPAEVGFITQKAATGRGGHFKSKAHEPNRSTRVSSRQFLRPASRANGAAMGSCAGGMASLFMMLP